MSNNSKSQMGSTNKRTYVDSETGRKVNDYIPAYISSKPWYYNNNEQALQVDSNTRKRKTEDEMYKELSDKKQDRFKHQRIDPANKEIAKNLPTPGAGINDYLEELQETTPALIFKSENNQRKNRRLWLKNGLCENCGGKHKKVECLEKPHKEKFVDRQGNKSSKILTKKETSQWDVKRDRWRDIDLNEEYDGIVENLKRKEEKALQKLGNREGDDEKDLIVEAITKENPLAIKDTEDIKGRDLADKPRYLEVIKTGEELRYNPKSRVYKDLNKGYLNERGQFIPYLTGEAAEFEKMKKFTKAVQNEHLKKKKEKGDTDSAITDKRYSAIMSPTTTMLKLKEKNKKEQIVKSAKEKELMEKYT